MLMGLGAAQSALLIAALCNMVQPGIKMSTRLKGKLVAGDAGVHEQRCGDGAAWRGRGAQTPTLPLLSPADRTMALGEAAEACLLAFQAWLLAIATTALACVKLATAGYHALLGLPGVQLIGRLAKVRPGWARPSPLQVCEAVCAPCLGPKAPRINALRVVEARAGGFET